MNEIEKISAQREHLLKVLNVVMASSDESELYIIKGLIAILIYSHITGELLIGDRSETRCLELVNNWLAGENAIKQTQEVLK